MPVILKNSDNEFIIRDPFYTGEWVLDGEAIALYLDFLRCIRGLALDDGTRASGESSALSIPEPLASFVSEGLPLKCDFSPDKIAHSIERSDRGIITPPVPIVEITPHCNYHCPWCFVPREPKAPMSMETIRGELVAPLLELGTEVFVLTGGEPSVELGRLESVCSIIREEANKNGVAAKIALLTNGSRLKDLSKRYKEMGISNIQVSVISADPVKDQKMRGIPASVNAVEEAFEGTYTAVQEGINVSFNFVLVPSLKGVPSNIDEIPEMVAWARRLGVYMIRIVPVVCSGEAAKNGVFLTLDELRHARELIARELSHSDDKTVVYSPIGSDVPPEKPVYCRAGNDVIYVSADGRTYPCNNLIYPTFQCGKLPLGAGGDNIAAIWRESPVLEAFRQPNEICAECARCNLRTECGGQCRAQLYWRYKQINLEKQPERCYSMPGRESFSVC